MVNASELVKFIFRVLIGDVGGTMLTFLFVAALAVAKIHATHVSMDAKIRDDSNLSQVNISI